MRTGNLFNKSDFSLLQVTSTAYRYGTSIGILPQGSYTFSATKSAGAQSIYLTANLNGTYSQTTISSVPFTFSADGESEYIIRTANNTGTTWEAEKYSDMMLNLGSTALPYEPYGWKVLFENHGENLWSEDYTGIDGNLKYVPVFVGDGTFTMSTDTPDYSRNAPLFLLSGNVASGASTPINGVYNGVSRTVNSSNGYVTIAFRRQSELTDPTTHKTMLTPGSTAKPYSPYLNETLPVYLGEVPTVRMVRKLVLDGTGGSITASGRYRLTVSNKMNITPICTHYKGSNVTSYADLNDGAVTMGIASYLTIYDSNCTTLAEYQTFLQQQYAAGHPVTVWYVLANEQTGISNEPLAKISTYADELTTIQVHGLSAPLYGIGDYKDVLNLSTGVVTRKVKRLVLDGTENWAIWSSGQPDVERYYYKWGKTTPSDYGLICTHLPFRNANGNFEHIRLGGSSRDDFVIYISKTIAPTVADFKSFLQQQYQNGTPVTVWYVLNTPETETVTVPTGMTGEIEGYLTQVSTPTPTNRSVPKWNGVEETGGTYAVTVYTPPEIPTTTGQNTLTVETEKIHGLTNPLCGIGDYKDVLNLSTGVITRKVKKLVLDGTETWGNYGSGNHFALTFAQTAAGANQFIPICSHFKAMQVASWNDLQDGEMSINPSDRNSLRIYDSRYQSDTTAFKTWLASEYSAGHPVTVWYVLSTPETETITVPYGLECSIEGYLTQSGTPTPSSPITPDSNGILESGGTYAVEVSLVPSNLTVKGHIKELT